MPAFMDVHHGMVGISAEGLAEAHAADLATQAQDGVSFDRAWADPVSGTVFCISTAPDAEAVRRTHTRAGHPADEVYPVPFEV